MTHTFDPNKHPRDRKGKFSAVVKSLKIGDEAKLPDGTSVKAVASSSEAGKRKFKVGDKVHDSAATATTAALDTSARNAHPKALGGKKKYKSFRHFHEATKPVPAAPDKMSFLRQAMAEMQARPWSEAEERRYQAAKRKQRQRKAA